MNRSKMDYPQMVDHRATVEPVPRRIRGYLDNVCVFDTTRAVYVWDSPKYPFYQVPADDVRLELLTDDGKSHRHRLGTSSVHTLAVGDTRRPGTARRYGPDADPAVAGTVRFEWSALDAWFEEDEEVYVHPRNPYTRVDALRSSRLVTIALAGVTLAESAATVMVFETGLPTRYYFDRTAVDFTHLVPSETWTECPYKGRTSHYWTARIGNTRVMDLAWSYAFPTQALNPIKNLVAFYNEDVDLTVDGRLMERPGRAGHRVS
jgi:uncharacterized protein (DUF427 family)